MVHHKVSVISGNGKPGCRDGDSTAAQFKYPSAIAVDREGNLIVLDSGNNRVRKVSPGGVVSSLTGNNATPRFEKNTPGFKDGHGTFAKFNFQGDMSVGLAINSDGNIILADTGNNRIRTISPDGLVSTLAGDGTKGYWDGPAVSASFNHPSGVAVDTEGNVIVSDTCNHCIRRITRDGHVSTIAGKPGCQGFADGRGVEALFQYPYGLSVNRRGFIYVADCGNDCIRRISPEGDVTTVAGNGTEGNTLGPNALSSSLNGPVGCAVNGDGNVIISDSGNGRVLKLTTDGQISCLAGCGMEMAYDFLSGDPCGIAINHSGDVVVCDKGNHCLRLIAAGLTPPETFARQAEDFEDGNSILSFLESRTLDPQFSDVKVHVGEETFHAHAMMLSRSPFFNAALTHDLIEGSNREITLTDMEPDTFRHVFNYIYTNKVDFSSDSKMLQLHAAAEFLGLSSLKRTCEFEIVKSLSVENVIQYFRLATKYSSDVLKRRCVEIASESVSSLTRVMLTTDYVDIMQNDLELHQDFVQACNTA